MTQGELAKKLGISRPYLNAILNGKMRPSIRLAKKICKFTGKKFFELRPDIKKLIKEVM